MTGLSLSLMGRFSATRDGKSIRFAYNKVRALLAYLALEGRQPVSRSRVAGLLWPDRPQTAALASLRQALARLHAALDDDATGGRFLRIERETVGIDPACNLWVDVHAFHAALAEVARHPHRDPQACSECSANRDAVLNLYRGDFLEDLALPDSDLFDEWTATWRSRLLSEVRGACRQQADHHARLGDWTALQKCAARLVALDPYDEPAHGQLMRALAQDGRPGEALAHYDALARTLRADLATEPSDEIRILAQRIRGGTQQAEEHPARPTLLPIPLTPLVGRSAELAELTNWLAGSSRRLITLTGPGGIGKTRLALAAAQAASPTFPDGVFYVDLGRIGATGSLSSAVAQSVGVLAGNATAGVPADPKERALLLVLDGFEHRMADRDELARLLERGSGLVALVTSRERLGLPGEWVFGLGGLEVPPLFMVDAMEEYSAVQLFRESARRVVSGFELTPENRVDVLEICRLVEGMPLAIDLAAAWVRAISCREIADEIRHSYDFLSLTEPDDKSGVRAAFDSSWDRLDEQHRRVLARLSVFRAGFDRQSASAVAWADVVTLASLIDKSLVRALPDGRYDLHDLITHYAGAKLAEAGGTAEAQRAHAEYFASVVLEKGDWTDPTQALMAFLWLCREYADLEAALEWAAAGDPPNDSTAARRLADFMNRGGHRWGVHLMGRP